MMIKKKITSINDIRKFKPQHKFFIGIDSDGTVFDSMTYKHENFYVLPLIKIFNLNKVHHIVRNIWNFVNIHSATRGINRFLALIETINLLKKFANKKSIQIELPELNEIETWANKTDLLSNDSLNKYLKEKKLSSKLNNEKKVLEWSKTVNNLINNSNYLLTPIKEAVECLDLLTEKADIMVISNTPTKILYNEWKNNNLDKYVSFIGGQETGSKIDMLNAAIENKYDLKKVLVIGDSKSDYISAKKNKSLFFPIIPSREKHSWKIFKNKDLSKFLLGSYTKSYEKKMINNFNDSLTNSLDLEI